MAKDQAYMWMSFNNYRASDIACLQPTVSHWPASTIEYSEFAFIFIGWSVFILFIYLPKQSLSYCIWKLGKSNLFLETTLAFTDIINQVDWWHIFFLNLIPLQSRTQIKLIEIVRSMSTSSYFERLLFNSRSNMSRK